MNRHPLGYPPRRRLARAASALAGTAALLLVLAAACSERPAAEAAATPPEIRAEDVWARPVEVTERRSRTVEAQGSLPNTAIYMTLHNDGGEADRLIGVVVPVGAAELHRTQVEDGVMRMRQVESIEVPAGGTVELRPGDYHIMVIGVDRSLGPGDRFPVRLVFEAKGEMLADAEVRQP